MTDSTHHAESVAGTKRLRVVVTESMWVDTDAEEARSLLDPSDYMDVYDAITRFRRIAAHDFAHIEYEGHVEDASDETPYGVEPVYGAGRERFLWSARHFVVKARTELSVGRYRDGNCPELDAVNRDLAAIEDRLRLMALAVDHPEQFDGSQTP